jgi:hypothetical protein
MSSLTFDTLKSSGFVTKDDLRHELIQVEARIEVKSLKPKPS